MSQPNPYLDRSRQYSTDDYNPYEQPRYNPYEQYGQPGPEYNGNHSHQPYTDELPAQEDDYYNNNSKNLYRHNTQLSNRSVPRSESQRSGFDQGEFTGNVDKKDPTFISVHPSQNLWTKGSRGRCVGRFCGCTLLVFLLLLLSIVGALLLWIRPPAVTVGDIRTQARDGSVITATESGKAVNLAINITVNNPNYFSVNFDRIKAELFYPINNTPIGGGEDRNVQFPSHTEKVYDFPLTIAYNPEDDPSGAVLADLGVKCLDQSDITIKYKITVGIKIVVITVSPVVENTVSFACPFDIGDLGIS